MQNTNLIEFLCPKCKRSPFLAYYLDTHHRLDAPYVLLSFWDCDKCNHSFDTFKSLGKCPKCKHEHKKTQCLSCEEISNHLDFYKGETDQDKILYQLKQEKYVGEWKEGKYHGKGTCSNYKYGFLYIGEWKDGKEHGQGTCTSKNGEEYIGEWKYGKREGFGTMETISGDKYVGEWKEGKYHGKGTYMYNQGWWREGLWQEGLFIEYMPLPFQEKEKKQILQQNQKNLRNKIMIK